MLVFDPAFTSLNCAFRRLRERVSVMAGKVRTLLLHPPEPTSSPTQSTCRSPVGAALTLWVCRHV